MSDSDRQQKLSSLYQQQRKISAARQGTGDSQLKQTLKQKQDLMSRRIGRLQAEKDE